MSIKTLREWITPLYLRESRWLSKGVRPLLHMGLLLLAFPALAQTSKEDLKREREAKQKEIGQTKKFINENKTKQKKTVTMLQALNSQINHRERLINNMERQVNMLETEIDSLNRGIADLEANLAVQRQRYAQMVVDDYKNRNKYSKISHVFASKNMHQALKRLKYLQTLSESRTKQLQQIRETQAQLNDRRNKILGIKSDKEEVITSKEGEKKELQLDKKEQQVVFQELKSKEKELARKLREQKESVRRLDGAIAEIIAREIEAERRRREEERKRAEANKKPDSAGKPAKKTEVNIKTAEYDKLTADFSGNRGRLPWPVENGFVISTFGIHPHPTLKNIMVPNNGIDISVNRGAKIRAVFGGTVKHVFSVPGMEKCVMVNHGDYYTVYCHLDNVTVKPGDKLSTKQVVGTVHTDEEEDRTVLQFQVWKGSAKMDPQDWLAR